MSIEEICKKYQITNYTINEDGSVDVNGDVYLQDYYIKELPLTFNKVTGSFYCSRNSLTTLKGSPKEVGSGFYCQENKLTNLEYCPEYIGLNFCCNGNNLTSLEK